VIGRLTVARAALAGAATGSDDPVGPTPAGRHEDRR